jgi:tetratricopeptide (TPR) repeat protein
MSPNQLGKIKEISGNSLAKPALWALALIGVLIIYSQLFVSPFVEQKYRRLSEVVMDEIGLSKSAQLEWPLIRTLDTDSIESAKKTLDLIEVYLRRCIEIDPANSWALYNFGLLNAGKSKTLEMESILSEKRNLARSAASFRSLAFEASQAAKESMNRLSQKSLPDSNLALSWVLNERLGHSTRSADRFVKLEADALRLTEAFPDSENAKLRLAQVYYLQAFDVYASSTTESRKQTLEKSLVWISSVAENSIITKAIHAEVLAATDGARAEKLSNDAAQMYWKLSDVAQRNPEAITSMFTCLVRLGNIAEAIALLNSRLPYLAPANNVATLEMCSDGLWRQMLCATHFPSTDRKSALAELFKLAISLEPRSEILFAVIEPADGNEFVQSLTKSLRDVPSTGLEMYLEAIQAALQEDWKKSRVLLESATKAQPNLAMAFSLVASRWTESQESNKGKSLQFLDQITRAMPKDNSVWLHRIDFCIDQSESEIAIDGLKRVELNAGDSIPVLEAVESRYRRLRQTDEVLRIRKIIETRRGEKS